MAAANLCAPDYSIDVMIILLTSADINLQHKRTRLVAPMPHEVFERPEARKAQGAAFGDRLIARASAALARRVGRLGGGD